MSNGSVYLSRRRNLDLGLDGDWLTGDIAVLSAYNRQLSSDEVEALAQAYSGRFNLLTQRKWCDVRAAAGRRCTC